jgi:hypothetical protein
VSSNAEGTGAVTRGTSINSNGLLTVSANETAKTLYVIATSVADTSISAIFAINVSAPVIIQPPVTPRPPVTQPPATPRPGTQQPPVVTQPPIVTQPVPPSTINSVTISPANQSTKTNSTVQFKATVTGTNNPNTSVIWKVSSNVYGTGEVAPGTSISDSGLLKVAPNEWSPTLYVIATAAGDHSKTATAAVTVTNANENQGSNRGRAQRQ